jgi:hypothetical protein
MIDRLVFYFLFFLDFFFAVAATFLVFFCQGALLTQPVNAPLLLRFSSCAAKQPGDPT